MFNCKSGKILLFLTVIGIFAHYLSFMFSLYGDDWLVIYLYSFPDGDPSRFGQLPGILSFLTPYGPSIFLMGKLYEIFGTNYSLYFIVSFLFKLFASWTLFLAIQKITKVKIISILISILFLVGFIGIQTTEWVFYMNVYLATAFFFLAIYFQFKFFETYKKTDLINQFIFFTISIIAAPVRLSPLVLIAPLIEASILFSKKIKSPKIIMIKAGLFLGTILFLWLIGVFGGPGKIHSASTWSVKGFYEMVFNDPIQSLNSILHWIGITAYPNHPTIRILEPKAIGFIFLSFSALGLILSRKERKTFILIITSGCAFFIFLGLMWFYSKLRLTDSPDRYLLLPFASYCIFLGILSAKFIKYFKNGVVVFLLVLIILNFFATRSVYRYWLSIGRGKDFAKVLDRQIMKDFPRPVTSQKIIFLQSDNTAARDTLQFGLLFRITILSNTWDIHYFNDIYNNKDELIDKITMKIKNGESKEEVINSVSAYGYMDNKFVDLTKFIRKDLSVKSY